MSFNRTVVEKATQLLGWKYRRQRIKPLKDMPIKVNLGCGMSVAPHWLNIDGSLNAWIAAQPRWFCPIAYRLAGAKQFCSQSFYCTTLHHHRFIFHNLKYGIPLPNQSTDFVYSSHFLEHLDRESGRMLLKECLRVLKPGGIVRIGVPDLALAWEMYQRGEKHHMLHDYFFVGAEAGFSQHRYAYDFELLAEVLSQIGFTEIAQMKFQQGLTPDLDVLDNRGEYTLFVEARRPSDKSEE